MGRLRSRLEDLISNPWFYVLKDTKTKKKPGSSASSSVAMASHAPGLTQKTHFSDQRKSCYLARDVPFISDSPAGAKTRVSALKNYQHYGILCSSASAVSDHALESSGQSFIPDTFDAMLSLSTSGKCTVKNFIFTKLEEPDRELSSSPIIPSSEKCIPVSQQDFKEVSTNQCKTAVDRGPGSTKLRRNPVPRSRAGKGSLWAECYAVTKISGDPMNDFRESMVEMIVENKIKSWEDLEELLACYLSLNSDEYRDLIISVFKQVSLDYISKLQCS